MAEELALKGRGAVITGAAGGIGGALAREAVSRGMNVAICDIDEARLEGVASELRAQGAQVIAKRVDVSDAADVARFGQAALDAFPSIGLVFANAGLLRTGSSIRPNLAEWDLVVGINLMGVVHVASALAGPMVDRGEPAQFVITGSMTSFIVGPDIGAYTPTKHALWAYADVMRMELAQMKSPVGVTLLCPGRVKSYLTAETRLRVVAAQGEAAARDYDAILMDPSQVAKVTFEAATAREFWALPDTNYGPMLRPRVEPLLKAATN